MQNFLPYCNSLTSYSRWKTRVVNIGGIRMGGDNPIRLQSMTTTDTMDTIGTVEQSIRMIDAGCEYLRITAPSLKEAQNLEKLKGVAFARLQNTNYCRHSFYAECRRTCRSHCRKGAGESGKLR